MANLKTSAYAAGLLAAFYIPIHVYWALGGEFLLPGGGQVAGLNELSATNWVVSCILALGAVVLFSLPRIARISMIRGGIQKVYIRAVLLFIGVGAVVCISHALFGFLTKGLFIAGLYTIDFPFAYSSSQQWSAALNDLIFFEPWFLLEGLALAVTGWYAQPSAIYRKWWLIIVGCISILIFALGITLTVMDRQLAV